MTANLALYTVDRTAGSDALTIKKQFSHASDQVFGGDYQLVAAVRIAGSDYVAAYDRVSGKASLAKITGADPWMAPGGSLQLDTNLDAIEPFVYANQSYLMGHRKGDLTAKPRTYGTFYFYAISDQRTASQPYIFYRSHAPSPTTGFTTVKLFTTPTGVVILGYNFDTGAAAMYTLTVTPTSPAGVPPLLALAVWEHQWAPKWKNFAFFQLGTANFFFKINVGSPNVNIDHIVDGIVAGTTEVTSHMHLQDAQALDLVAPMVFGRGDPYLATYKKNGTAAFYRFFSDCSGFAPTASLAAIANADHLVPIGSSDSNMLLVC